MNYKIIETSEEYPNVLIRRDRDENGKEIVVIMAIGRLNFEEDMFAQTEISFPNKDHARNFIKHFLQQAAEDWCKEEGIEYFEL